MTSRISNNIKAITLAGLTVIATSCTKQRDLLMGKPVNVELAPSQPTPDSDLAINYPNPIIINANEDISPIMPAIGGRVYPEVTPNYVVTLFGNNNRVSGDANGPNPADVTFRAPIRFLVEDDITIFLLEDGDYQYHSRIRKLLPKGDIRSSIFAGGGNDALNIDGAGTSATFDVPLGITKNPVTGDFYVTDKNRIRKVTPQGVVTTFAGAKDNTAGYINGSPENARFNYINDIVSDEQGNLYVSDRDNHCIRKYTIATNQFSTLSGPTESFVGTKNGFVDGTATVARYNVPAGLALDKANNLFVVDRTNRRIRKVDVTNGSVTTIAGNNTSGVIDGIGTSASFRDPWFISIAPNSDLYVGEYNAAATCIRKINTTTLAVTKITGKGTATSQDGLMENALLDRVSGVEVAKNGNIYFAERDGALRMIVQCAYGISPALPTGLRFDPYTGVITGKATVASPRTTYTVTAYTGRGEPAAATEFYLTVQ